MPDQAQRWETLLARLFVEPELRARFKRDPKAVGLEFGLEESALRELAGANMSGLDLAARSYSRKRTRRSASKRVARWLPWSG